MVTPTSYDPPDFPEPPESKDGGEVESPIPAEIVEGSLTIPEAEKELGEIKFSPIETPTEEAAATTEIATEILQIPTLEDVENEEDEELIPDDEESEDNEKPVIITEDIDDQGLASSQTIEVEFEETEEADTTEEMEPEVADEAILDLSTEEIPSDMLDPKAQDFRKLLDELLPLDDNSHILTPEEIDKATYLIDFERNIFYTRLPLSQEELSSFKPTMLLLGLTEEEIGKLKITYIKPKKWHRLIRYLKMHP